MPVIMNLTYFYKILIKTNEKPFLSVITVDFNTRSSS